MYSLKKIVINNLFSFKNLEYYFEKRPILLIGKNLDDSGQERNGSGKSSFIESIFIAFTGDSLRGVTNNDIVKKGEKEGKVILEIENNENIFIIERTFSLKSSATCKLFFIDKNNNKNEKVLSSINEYNKFILNHLDISKDDILSFFIITKDIKTFLSSNDSNRKSIISRFSNIQMLDFTKETIDKSLNECNNEIYAKDKLISNLNGKLSIIDEQIKEQEEKINKENIKLKINEINKNISINNEKIESLKDNVLIYNNEITDIEKQIIILEENKENNENIILLKNKLNDINNLYKDNEKNIILEKNKVDLKKSTLLENINKLDDNKKEISIKYNEKIDKQKSSINDLKALIDDLNNESLVLNKTKNEIGKILTGKIECPSCNFIFIYNNKSYNVKNSEKELENIDIELKEIFSLISKGNEKIENKKINIENIENELNIQISSINEKRKNIKSEILFIDDELNKLKKLSQDFDISISSINREIRNELEKIETLIFDKNRLIKKLLNNIDLYKNNISIIEMENNKLLKSISLLNDTSDIKDKINVLLDSKEKIKLNIESIEEEKQIFTNKIEEINKWSIHLKSFKNYLFNKTINYISEITNKCLRNMNSNISLSIEGYKELKNGKIKEEINISVYRNGFDEGSFKKFSAGEKGRMDMANILAIQELVNMNSENSINLLVLDEILDSCDSHGLELIFNSLKEMNKTILIVSQGEIKSLKEDTIVICKENGESRLIL